MKVRMYGAPFWDIFLFCIPLHILILLVPTINFISALVGNVSFETVKYNVIGGLIYLIITSIGVLVPYFIRRIKFQKIMILNSSGCSIVLKSKVLMEFAINDISCELDYPNFKTLFYYLEVHFDGHLNLDIISNDNKKYHYELAITRIKAKSIIKYLNKHRDVLKKR